MSEFRWYLSICVICNVFGTSIYYKSILITLNNHHFFNITIYVPNHYVFVVVVCRCLDLITFIFAIQIYLFHNRGGRKYDVGGDQKGDPTVRVMNGFT